MREPSPVTVAAVGDLMMGDSATCVGFGFRSRHPGATAARAFDGIRPLLAGAELVIGNLECPLAAPSAGGSRYRTEQMRGDIEYAAVLRAVGFNAMSVANNHAVQHGVAGFQETVEALRSRGMYVLGLRGTDGWCAAPAVHVGRDGTRVGLLGYCWRPRQYGSDVPPFAEGSVGDVVRDVQRLRATTDAVVVVLHWGEEFLAQPSSAEVAQADAIVAAGASLVLGHHPHVIRPVQRRGDAVVAYSLGNCVTDMLWQEQLRHGLVLRCALAGGGVGEVATHRIRVDRDCHPQPVGAAAPVVAAVDALAADDYARAVAASVRRQQLASYAYAARNAWRFPPAVLAQLVAVTLRNKWAALGARLRAPRPMTVAR